MGDNINIALYGVGEIGALIAKTAHMRGLNIVGAIDIDPKKIGKDLSEVIGLKEKMGVTITDNTNNLKNVDIVLHSTGTYLDRIYNQLETCIKLNCDVISTCETLSYPYYRYSELAKQIDQLAKKHGVTVIGTGVNPGFILDTLVAILTSPSWNVEYIRAIRSLNAAYRRSNFQKKIGVGMTPEEAKKKINSGEITGHVGYAESVLLISKFLNLEVNKVEENQMPVIAKKNVKVGDVNIEKGYVLGLKGYGIGYQNDKEIIRVELRAYIGAKDYEDITIKGTPEIRWRSNGTQGDIATAGMIVNMIPRVLETRPGLLTMADLEIPRYFSKIQ
ncbi:MAG: dihydrodipicolinate reductase [Thermoprotei archaeon]